jgi:hypothetical protein
MQVAGEEQIGIQSRQSRHRHLTSPEQATLVHAWRQIERMMRDDDPQPRRRHGFKPPGDAIPLVAR